MPQTPTTRWSSDDPARWDSDEFLDEIRASVDAESDAVYHRLRQESPGENFSRVFAGLNRNDADTAHLPQALRDFIRATGGVPSPGGRPMDPARWERGAKAFSRVGGPACLSLLLKAVPEGYQAPNLTRILTMTGELEKHSYRRLLGVLQMVIDVCQPDGCSPSGRTIITGQKLRLLHSGIRAMTPRLRPEYRDQFGVPINHEDMLGTIMGFSLLVVDGVALLGSPMTAEEADDFYSMWVVFALAIGIHPDGDRNSLRYMPRNLDEARVFYAAYGRRHYVSADKNPDAAALMGGLTGVLNSLVPNRALLRAIMRRVALVLLKRLIGKEAMCRLGVPPSYTLLIWKVVARMTPFLWNFLVDSEHRIAGHEDRAVRMSQMFLQKLVARSFAGQVEFLIPRDLKDLQELVQKPAAKPMAPGEAG